MATGRLCSAIVKTLNRNLSRSNYSPVTSSASSYFSSNKYRNYSTANLRPNVPSSLRSLNSRLRNVKITNPYLSLVAIRNASTSSPAEGTATHSIPIETFAAEKSPVSAAPVTEPAVGADAGQTVIDLTGASALDPSEALNIVSQALSIEQPLREVTKLSWYAWPIGAPIREYIDFGHWLGIPWWGCIAISTLTLRILIFPLYRRMQENMGKMTHINPRIQEYELKKTEARLSGNMLELTKYEQKQQELYALNGISPTAPIFPMLAQSIFLLSNINLLRSITESSLPSLKTGGALWFMDLTGEDPYFALPLIACATLAVSLEIGAETGQAAKAMSSQMRMVMRGMPILLAVFLYFWSFPNAMLVYFCTNNLISLTQAALFKQPAVRKYLNLPKPLKFSADDLPLSKKTFVQSMKDSMENKKMVNKMNEAARLSDVAFKRAGIGPIKKTYKYDPTLRKPDA